MSSSKIRLDRILATRDPDDQLDPTDISNIELDAVSHFHFLKGILSQLKQIIHGDQIGNWFDPVTSIHGGDASLYALYNAIVTAGHVFEATCLATDQVGYCVYIRAGVDAWGNYRVGKTNIELDLKVPVIGIIIEKIDVTSCLVQSSGELSGFSGLAPGKMVFVGRDALIQQAPIPEPDPGEQVFIQRMGTALSVDTISLNPDFQLVKRVGT